MFEDRGETPEEPPLGPYKYMMDALFRLGPVTKQGPIAWTEMYAYSQLTGFLSTAWEFHTLHEMSRAYWDEMDVARSLLAIAPLEREYD